MARSTRNLSDGNIVAAHAGQHMVNLAAISHLFAESELARTVTTPRKYFCEFFWGHALVVIETENLSLLLSARLVRVVVYFAI